ERLKPFQIRVRQEAERAGSWVPEDNGFRPRRQNWSRRQRKRRSDRRRFEVRQLIVLNLLKYSMFYRDLCEVHRDRHRCWNNAGTSRATSSVACMKKPVPAWEPAR